MPAPLCQTTGRRKRSVARVRFVPGSGTVTVNGRPVDDYFPSKVQREALLEPLTITETIENYDIDATIHGGGSTGQAGALRHGISRALVLADENLKQPLKEGGFLTRDPRMKARKKSGQPGARKRFQFSKR